MTTLEQFRNQHQTYENTPFFYDFCEYTDIEGSIGYYYEEEGEKLIYEAVIYLPLREHGKYEWSCEKFHKIGDMRVHVESYQDLDQTPEWFQRVAKEVDRYVRLDRILG
jgi:hypothetical protein